MDALTVLLKNIILSTLHGWAGASLAVFMFFRPLKPWRVGRVKIWQGVIPSRQAQIAEAVSDVVARELITPQALLDFLARERLLKRGVQSALHDLILSIADTQYPSVESIFLPLAAGIKADLKGLTKDALAEWAEKYITDPDAGAWLKGFSHRRLKYLWQKKVGEIWPEEKAAAFIDCLLVSLAGYVSGTEFKAGLLGLIEHLHGFLCKQTIPLREVLPRPLKDQAAGWPALLARVLPELVKRLQDNEEILERLTVAILDALERFKEKGSMARIGISLYQYFSEYRTDVKRFVHNEMFPRLGGFLSSPEAQLWLERYIRDQADRFLGRRVGDLAKGIGPEYVAQVNDVLAASLGNWIAGADARNWLGEVLLGRYRDMAGCTLAGLAGRFTVIDPEELEALLASQGLDLLRQPVTRRFVRLAARSLVERIADYKVGRLRDRLSPAALEKIEDVSVELVTFYLKSKVPAFLDGLDLKEMVKARIDSYSPGELVAMIQRVTVNNLQKIEIYGAVIGTVMGVFFGLANLRADAFWFIAAVLAIMIGLIRWGSRK
ncbi:MAG: hypothetical protein A4E55_01556 [Pelotomaculum sp. PtaU1.Bin035]|nr:MAG: hypothetical protein A4E55_01556 [Pelotomaculum sp. PtaU1.Bin035]